MLIMFDNIILQRLTLLPKNKLNEALSPYISPLLCAGCAHVWKSVKVA